MSKKDLLLDILDLMEQGVDIEDISTALNIPYDWVEDVVNDYKFFEEV